MSIKNVEYYASVDNFKTPLKVEQATAIGSRLLNLITMEPGSDPLHPDMGVGITTYRYGVDNLSELSDRIQNQIETYLPFYQDANITLVKTKNKMINVEITVGDMTYIYDSSTASKPITLTDL